MLDHDAKLTLRKALLALRNGDAGGWNALAPLSQLSAQGTDISIDFSTETLLGAPLIIARPAVRPRPALTPRQSEVATCLATGQSNKAIARTLAIAPATVKDHVRALIAAFGVTSRAEVIAALLGSKTG